MSVCLSVCPHYRSFTIATTVFVRSFSIWNVGHPRDNEDQVWWPITSKLVNMHICQFTSDHL